MLSFDIANSFTRISELLRYLATVEFHPPLYYLLLRAAWQFFGANELSTKLLSLVFGLACIVVTYFLGKVLFQKKKVALLAAFIVAILPFQLQFSQEARPYIIYCFFAALAAWCWWQYYRQAQKKYLVGYIAANIVGLYLHYSYLLIIGAFASWGLIEIVLFSKTPRGQKFLPWLLSNSLVFLAFSGWLTPFFYKVILGHDLFFGWARVYSMDRSPRIFASISSQLIWLTKANHLPISLLIIIFLVQIFLSGVIIYALVKLLQAKDRASMAPVAFLAWLVVFSLVSFVLSPQSMPYVSIYEKHIIFSTIALALLFAWAMAQIPSRWFLAVALVFCISLVPYDSAILANDAEWDPDYALQTVGQFINAKYQPGDMVIIAYGIARTDLTHYLSKDIPVYELLPLNYYDNQYDIYASRSTLGLVENEYQTRFTPASEAEIAFKIEELVKLHHPTRVWLYAFLIKDYPAHHWFLDRGWLHPYRNVADVFPLDLYSQPVAAITK